VFQLAGLGVTSSEPMFVTNHRNWIVYLNAGASDLLGLGQAEACGLPCWHLLGGTDPEGNRFCRRNCPLVRAALRGEMLPRFSAVLRVTPISSVCVSVYPLALYPGGLLSEPLIVHLLSRCTCSAGITEEPDGVEAATAEEPGQVRWCTLTVRELEILRLMHQGVASDEIARRLFISRATVRTHVSRVLSKLGVHSKLEAVARARHLHLV
jgi:DNA-binding CsgD family transcriptional regulator